MKEFKAREKMLDLVKEQGWELDTSATIINNKWDQKRIQDPYTFLRAAKHGGNWRIHLNYYNYGSAWSSGSYDGILRDVKVTYIPIGGEPKGGGIHSVRDMHDRTFVLDNTDKVTYGATSWLWKALDNPSSPKPLSLRQRAERLVKDPDLAIWLAAEARHEDQVRRQEREEAYHLDQEERRRLLPITVDRGEWRNLTDKLKNIADALYRADGKSDLPKLTIRAREAIEAITDVIKEES